MHSAPSAAKETLARPKPVGELNDAWIVRPERTYGLPVPPPRPLVKPSLGR